MWILTHNSEMANVTTARVIKVTHADLGWFVVALGHELESEHSTRLATYSDERSANEALRALFTAISNNQPAFVMPFTPL